MKKTIIVAVLLAAVIGVFIFSYQYRNQLISQQTSVTAAAQTTEKTETTQSAGEESEGRTLVAEDKENDYQIYFDGENTDIVHGEYKKTFTSWTYSMNCEDPIIYCKDYDGDGENELALKIVNGKLDVQYDGMDSPYTYAIYLFEPVTTSDGEKTFECRIASADTWKAPFDSAIICEMTQPKICNKFLQFTMDDIDEKIIYNEKTGLTESEYAGYALALSDSSKNYYTLSRWSKGAGIYDIDENGNITLDIQIFANYEEIKDTQYIGNIHCDMGIVDERFSIVPHTIYFKAVERYSVTDPRDAAKVKWNCVISNESQNTNFKSTDIDWIEAEFSLANTSDKSAQYFETYPSKIKCVDSVKFTQSEVVLIAKKGYTFSQTIAESGKFSVTVNSGEKNEYDISYSCSVKTENNTGTLTIKFDKTYDKEDFDKVLIKFGV